MNSRRLMLAPLMTEHRTGKNYRAGRGNAKGYVRFTPNSDRESEFPQQGHVRFTPDSGHVQCKGPCLLLHVRCN
jgi:hypothetical protein